MQFIWMPSLGKPNNLAVFYRLDVYFVIRPHGQRDHWVAAMSNISKRLRFTEVVSDT